MSLLHAPHLPSHPAAFGALPAGHRWGWPDAQSLGRAASELWWLNPLVYAAILLAVYSTFMGFDFLSVVPRAYIPGWHYAWGAALLVTMCVGMVMVMSAREPRPLGEGAIALDVPSWAMAGLLLCALFAYSVWFAPLVSEPRLVLEMLSGERSNVRGEVHTTPGVTTMTQFGMAYAIAYAAVRGSRARPLEGWEHVGMALMLLLAAVRAVVWSERLAVIEVGVVCAVAALAYTRVTTQRGWRIGTIVPLVAPLLLYVVFTATEYLRSWGAYRNEYDSVWAFAFERLLTYYATASNNGIGLLVENNQWPMYSGRFVAEWLYMMPGVGEWMREELGDPMTYYTTFLDRFARPEFNSATGLFQVVFDLGYAGSMLYFLAVGAAIGSLWMGWRRQSPLGVLFYPVCVMFLFELLRFNYFAATRFLPLALALLLVWLVSRQVSMPPVHKVTSW